MRRILGGLALFLGVLSLVLGLAAGVLYDRIGTLPLDIDQTVVSEGHDVSAMYAHRKGKGVAFDRLTGRTVRTTRVIKGVPGKVPQDKRDDNAFWQLGRKTEIIGAAPIALSIDGVSIDRRTAAATNCCGDFVSQGTAKNPTATKSVSHEGLFFTWPLDAQQKTYPFWDGELRAASDAVFARTEQVQGLDTNVYIQKIPTTTLPDKRTVPAAMFTASAKGSVTATQEYSNTRTFWVEPVTGVIIKAQEDVSRVLVSPRGRVTMIDGVIGYTEQSQRDLADEYRPKAEQLRFVQQWLRPLGLGLGAVLTLLGLALLFAHRRGAAAPGAPLTGTSHGATVGHGSTRPASAAPFTRPEPAGARPGATVDAQPRVEPGTQGTTGTAPPERR